jgi:NADH-quinone oxidoreductase subunit L
LQILGFLWLIPVLPLLGFATNGLLGRRALSKKAVSVIACGTVLASFLLSVGVVAQLGHLEGVSSVPGHLEVDREARRVTLTSGAWLEGGTSPTGASLSVPWGFTLDPLSAVMLLVVTGVGFLIHVYSVGYMSHEEGYYRYFSYLNLFMAMMLVLVLGSSFVVMFVGWEGVGLCSYLLIGFDFGKDFAADAGKKAFLVNRVGDAGFILGMAWIFASFGTLSFAGVMGRVESVTPAVAAGIGVLLFVGACGKSAQIPLYVWLPDAMAGPTPVSALIHAATMVTAGVYMVCRCSALFLRGPGALMVVAVVGALTALLAATMAVRQTDIKKVLAYSTVSQLGYMFLAAGVGAFSAAIFHLMTHAFFKALLFLGSGSVIHAMSGEQDLRKMGGLRKHLPVTYGTFLVATLAIAGIPGFSGFFSKDEILWKSYGAGNAWGLGGPAFWLVGVVAAGLTAFYMFRLVFLAFHGEGRMDAETAHHVHESPKVMTVPLMALAVLSVVGGWVGIPKVLSLGADLNGFEHYLSPVFEPGEGGAASVGHAGAGLELGLMALALGVVAAGILAAVRLYLRRPESAARLAEAFPVLARLLANKYYVDELYDAAVVGPYRWLCGLFAEFDRRVVDGLVNATGAVAEVAAQVLKLFQTGYVRNYALALFLGALMLLWYLL